MAIVRTSLLEDTSYYDAFDIENQIDDFCEKLEEYIDSPFVNNDTPSKYLEDLMINDIAIKMNIVSLIEDQSTLNTTNNNASEKPTIDGKLDNNNEKLKAVGPQSDNFATLRQVMKVIQKDLSSKRIVLVLKSVRKSKLKQVKDFNRIDERLNKLFELVNKIEEAVNTISLKLDSLNKENMGKYTNIERMIRNLNDRYKQIVSKNNELTAGLSKMDEVQEIQFVNVVDTITRNLNSFVNISTSTSQNSQMWSNK